MKNKVMLCMLFVGLNCSANEIKTTQKGYSVKVGSSRVIYQENSRGASLTVTNPEEYPVLIQSNSYAENKTSPGNFIVIPPLFRLESLATSRLKIILKNDIFPKDKETMEWLCIKGVPPVDANDAAKKNGAPEVVLQVSMNTCNKIFFRPSTLPDEMLTYAEKIKWEKNGEKVTAYNNSPYYINFDDLKIGGMKIFNPQYVAPFSSKDFITSRGGDVEWKVVTDTGGDSRTFKSDL